MTNFINEHWIGTTIYLIGCILAYGRLNSQIHADFGGWANPMSLIAILMIGLSWVGLIYGISISGDGGKFFKWLPILLWCVVGVGCESYYIPHDKPIITIKVHGNHCDYIVDNRNDAIITAPCGWYKIGDMPIRPLDTLK